MLRRPAGIMGPVGTIVVWLSVVSIVAYLAFAVFGCSNTKLDSPYAQIQRAWKQACNIKDKQEPPGQDYWQPPEITIMLGTGDCEDKAILLWYLLRHVHKVKNVYMVGGQAHELFHRGGHAWVEIGSGPFAVVLDPTTGFTQPRYMLNEYTYAHCRNIKEHEIRAKIFMDVTGHRNLNPLWGWR